MIIQLHGENSPYSCNFETYSNSSIPNSRNTSLILPKINKSSNYIEISKHNSINIENAKELDLYKSKGSKIRNKNSKIHLTSLMKLLEHKSNASHSPLSYFLEYF